MKKIIFGLLTITLFSSNKIPSPELVPESKEGWESLFDGKSLNGVIVGRALYEGSISLEQALKAFEK